MQNIKGRKGGCGGLEREERRVCRVLKPGKEVVYDCRERKEGCAKS